MRAQSSRRGRSTLHLATALLIAVAVSGCWGGQWVRAPGYTEEIRADVTDLNARNEELLKRLAAMEKAMEDQSELLRSLRAESASSMEVLQERIQNLEERLRSGGSRGGSSGATSPLGSAGTSAPDSASAGPASGSRAVYDAAYLQLLKGNYDLAITSFTDYLARFPTADLADNAQYWIGECYLARNETARAIEAFSEVGSKWPQGDKAPGALLKIATTFQGEGDTAAARRTFQDLMARYPNSDEARLARERLAGLPEGN